MEEDWMDMLTEAQKDEIGLITTAAFAFAAHAAVGQRRKYTGEHYFNHPLAVMHLLKDHGINDSEVLQATLLHDVLEDTQITRHDLILAGFNSRIVAMVTEVTNVYTKERYAEFNRAERSRRECQRLADVSANAQNIKVADLIDNTKDIVDNDPEFAKVYLKEKEALLEALTEADPGLRDTAYKQLRDAQEKLNDRV